MFEVLIVEDDQLYRYEIRTLVNWEKCGFKIIGEAINGKQALIKIEEKRPDVVFTDISMPGMNGVELIKVLKDKYPEIKIIVLSSYDDFSFVKDAMKFGAIDYILKYELEKPVMEEYLDKLREQLMLESEANKEKHYLESNKYKIAHEYFRGVLQGNPIDEEQMRKNLKVLKRKVDGNSMAVADICFYQETEWQKIDFMNRESVEYSEQNILLKVKENEFVLVMFFRDTHSQLKIYNDIVIEIKRFVRAIEQDNIQYFSIGVSDSFENWKYLKKAYDQAHYTAERKFFNGYGRVEFYNAIPQQKITMNKEEYYNQLEEMIRNGKTGTACKQLDEFLLFMSGEVLTEKKIKKEIEKHLNLIYKVCLEEKINFEKVSGEDDVSKQLIDGIDTDEKFKQLFKEYLETIKGIMDHPVNIENKSHKKEVYWIKKYIEDNYMNEINLDILAEELNFTPSYICRIFKNNTGIRITEYLNQVRIEKAKKLIKQTNLKVHEISEMVGFARVSYFCTTFKKVTGIKVSDFKESL